MSYLMELNNKAKVEDIKYSRYTTLPPHLVGKVSLITCDPAFLPPHSSGAGAGKEDLQEATMCQVKQNREEAKSGEEGESSREHLVPKTKRVNAEDGFIERKDLMQGIKALICLKVDKASCHGDSTMTKMTILNKQLETYFTLAGNSEMPADIRADFWDMIRSTQAEIKQLQNSLTLSNQVLSQLSTPRRSTASSSGTTSCSEPISPVSFQGFAITAAQAGPAPAAPGSS